MKIQKFSYLKFHQGEKIIKGRSFRFVKESDFFRGRWSRRHGKMAKMSDSSFPVIYQLKVVLLGISPMIWRRLQVSSDSTIVSSDSTIEDLH